MSPQHFVLSSKANWSHLRSLCILATRLVGSQAITVTLLIANNEGVIKRVIQEVARGLNEEAAAVANGANIRIVGLPTAAQEVTDLDDAFRLTWRALMSEKPILCDYELNAMVAAIKPSIAILDASQGFQLSWLETIRSEPFPPPIFQWMMAFSGGLLYMCGPTEHGGRAGQPIPLTGHSCLQQIQIPGMPVMTCRELHPQSLGDKEVKIRMVEGIMTRFLSKADGLLTTCAVEYDGKECLDFICDWFEQSKERPTFHIGPMLPLVPGTQRFFPVAIEAEVAAVPGQCGQIALDFLDRAIRSHGERSVFYISFGTEHWPSSPEHIEELLNALRQRRHPFIFSHAHPSAKIPEQTRAHFETTGLGLFLPFAPQQAILAHKACGWFITHGGANGTVEAITQSVPMIGWPFAVDQPLNVAHMARTLDVGFELTAVRTGNCPVADLETAGTDPATGNLTNVTAELGRILDETQGAVGRRKRANAERIGADLGSAWSLHGGRARQELLRFVAYCESCNGRAVNVSSSI